MLKKYLKKVSIALLSSALIMGVSVPAFATSDIDYWNVQYSAPAAQNTVNTLHVNIYGGSYKAYCDTLNGSSTDRSVTYYCTSPLTNKVSKFTTASTTPQLYSLSSTNASEAIFKVTLVRSNGTAYSTGSIGIYYK